jgi:peptide/nickel transport system substrate-binding protein
MGTVLLGSACGGGGDGSTGGADGNEDSGAPPHGGDLVYALEAETSGGWCIPEAQLAISGMMVAWSIYDFLLVPSDEGKFSGYLAESYEVSDDATQFTLSIRPDVTFHDGSSLDAEVVKNNIDAWLGRYPGRTAVLFPLVLDQVDTVEALDDMTVSITTKIPWPAFPAYLYGGGRLGIMAQAQLDDPDDCDKNLIGTGPYKLEDWKVNESLTMARNEDYWATDADGNQLPYLDSLEFRPVPDSQTRVNGLLGGEYDIVMTSDSGATETLQSEADAGSVELEQTTENTEVGFTMFNESHPPFDDPQARLAAAVAIDREQYRESVDLGMMEMASGPFPPGAPGYLEDAGYPEYNIGRARALVADYEERTGDRLEFTYTHAANESALRAAQFLQQQWETADMVVHLQSAEQASLINIGLGTDWDTIGFRNFPGGVPDGNYPWWRTGSPINFGRIADPELDALMDQGRSELDPDAAEVIYQDVNRHINEQVHFAWNEWVKWTVATKPGIGGILGAQLPDGSGPSEAMATGRSTAAIYDDR